MYNDWKRDVKNLESVPGDLAEFGVYEGARCFEMLGAFPDRTIWAWDTFEGMPDDNYIEALDKSDPPGKWKPKFDVIKKFSEVPNIIPIVGKFSETIPLWNHPDVRFAFVHIDCDHYWAYYRVLRFVAPLMSPGGIIKLDDYGCCSGATKATDEWLAEVGRKLEGDNSIYF